MNNILCDLLHVGAAAGCDLLILIIEKQKIAAFGSAYRGKSGFCAGEG
ncbi:hypothetical protein [Pseudomonas fluorescens]|nr:hypothetical protein [Pseudomonas fluorescens]